MSSEKILVTGGAGYIGSIAVKRLIEEGYEVVVVDNLSKGIRELIDRRASFYEVDLINREKLFEIFEREKPAAVMHFAAYKSVEESMKDPLKYSQNVTGVLNLLNSMARVDCDRIIYSSSAAVYGKPKYLPIDEKHPLEPMNYYGYTKLVGERLIEWHSRINGLQFVCLRYFNVIGDGGLSYVDPSPENVLPILMKVVWGKQDKFVIFGNDYETPDGTCIRDYIDVNDLVDAHILALDLRENEIINLGSSKGVSVRELAESLKEVSGVDFPIEISNRRVGDSPSSYASNEKAMKLLGWKPKRSFRETLEKSMARLF